MYPDPAVRPPVDELAADLAATLGRQLTGLYLYGSAVAGGYVDGISDLDLVAVTRPDASALDLVALDAMHAHFVDRHREWNDRLEIVYVGRATLRDARRGGTLAVMSPGEAFHLRDDAAEWLANWYLVRETGLALIGPPATELFPPLERAEFLASIRRYAHELRDRDMAAATPAGRAYTVLTMCRALRTLQTGKSCSKEEAAAWARERVSGDAALIDAALACRLARGGRGFDTPNELARTVTFVSAVARLIDDLPRA